MKPARRVALSWSSGKDSAWSLHLLRQDPSVEVVALITTLNQEFDRVAMHAVRRELLEAQADAVGLPLWTVPLPWPCSNAEYEERMRAVCARALAEKIEAIAFGDLFLTSIREYREKQLSGTPIPGLGPADRRPCPPDDRLRTPSPDYLCRPQGPPEKLRWAGVQ